MKNGIWKEFFGRVFSSKKKEAEEEVELIKLNKASLSYYQRFVKGNENITEDQANRKMTRNMLLALPYKRDSDARVSPRVWYSYGCLRFIVKDGEVIWIQNKLPVMKSWHKDYEKYEILNKKLEIVDDVGYGLQIENEKIVS